MDKTFQVIPILFFVKFIKLNYITIIKKTLINYSDNIDKLFG